MESKSLNRMVKAELVNVIEKLSTELAALRTENSAQRASIEALRAENQKLFAGPEVKYPFKDYRGRPYRIEMRNGCRVRCFASEV